MKLTDIAKEYADEVYWQGPDSDEAKALLKKLDAKEKELKASAAPKVQRGYVSITRKLEILRKKYAKASRLEKLEEKKKYLASIRSLHATKKKWRLR